MGGIPYAESFSPQTDHRVRYTCCAGCNRPQSPFASSGVSVTSPVSSGSGHEQCGVLPERGR
jgi:hypothetical protein